MATAAVYRFCRRLGVRRLRTRTLRVRTSSPSENVARDHPGFSPPAPNHKPQDRFGPWGFTGEEDGDWSGSSVLQSLGSSPTRTPSLAWWFSPPAPNHKPQDRFGPWGFTGEEDGHGSDGLDLPWLGSLLTQTPSLGGGSHLTHPKTWTLRSVMPLRVRVLGEEDSNPH
jgi:hypothetical protein